MKKCAYIFDIDGTLAFCGRRLHFILPPTNTDALEALDSFQPDWDSFYANCDKDSQILDVANILRRLVATGVEILFVTGRPEKCRKLTVQWLNDHITSVDPSNVFMRTDGDHRHDYVVKKEIYETHIKGKYYIQGVFEDRNACVDMWRKLGLTCFQVADGSY